VRGLISLSYHEQRPRLKQEIKNNTTASRECESQRADRGGRDARIARSPRGGFLCGIDSRRGSQ